MQKQHVVVTGLGLSTSLGQGVESNWQALQAGSSNFKASARLAPGAIRTRFAAVDERFESQRNPRVVIETYLREVIAEATAVCPAASYDRLYYSVPSGMYYWYERLRDATQVRADNAFFAFSSEEALGSELVSTYSLGEYPTVVATACASSASALQLGYEAIANGLAERVIVAASDSSIYDETVSKFNNLSALSTRNDSPHTACRPFSADRDGFVIGEAGACLVLESVASAKARGARVLARFSGCASTTDNFHRTKGDPNGAGMRDCMRLAVESARLQPGQVDCVNAHGTSTPENDRMEAQVIAELFPHQPWVTSVKSMLGHTVHAAGAVEAVVSVLSLMHQVVTPTLNYDGSLDNQNIRIASQCHQGVGLNHVLSNSFGFGGQNVALVFSAPEQGCSQ
ncbi:beta-ketoacyl-[acyl-carrier-protein] synthase family protein [Pseudomonas promysalinigenes]|uniref:Beta-ketoacyl synthase n=1 Tax=Pseudomonas putida TaxID=303 RepID=G8AA89_PSEPU|nr:beta-ketoacyl-[acyl-carrier-protein] synthase family protein [Pseudomonas promysalinigenes]ADQ74619.1 beta-ketoacyl synthase [Pseudomonas putida]QXI32360.1 beta-ketoacyl-[acyl-carrier-protein] synthase family protein [Pseudomonas promysalinigenes]